ncbi:MAG TPA: DNA alkylation repair protein [Terriglobales bacterium]|nr:DNA alkylation repair protein [Terriglobales bacterium]
MNSRSERRKKTYETVFALRDLQRELAEESDPKRARNLAWFFKTGAGQYGEGDQFCGITVPAQRKIARRYEHLRLPDIKKLLQSPVHEHRFTALEILVLQYERGDEAVKNDIFAFYLANTRRINNWDLVDTSAPYIIGAHLLSRPRRILYRLAKSSNLWERRIAMVSTMAFSAKGELRDTFAIAELLLEDKHDLIHKAVGWMLREAGKRSQTALLEFLKRNYLNMPRTALRYAIERLPEPQRKRALKGEFE